MRYLILILLPFSLTASTIVIEGDYLFWKPLQPGMSYALEANTPNASTNLDAKEQNFAWNSGLRIAMGYLTLPLETFFSWTRFHQSVQGQTDAPFVFATELFSLANVSSGTFYQGGNSVNGSQATSQWKLKFDMLDLDIKYCFQLPHIFLKAFLGLKGGWINQNQLIHYDHFINTSTLVEIMAHVNEVNQFSGIGPKMGCELEYFCQNDWKIKGTISSSLLIGYSKNPTFLFSSDQPSTIRLGFSSTKVIPTTQIVVGIQKALLRQKLILGIFYESQFFWSIWRNQSSAFQNLAVPNTGYQNLMMQGLTLQASLFF